MTPRRTRRIRTLHLSNHIFQMSYWVKVALRNLNLARVAAAVRLWKLEIVIGVPVSVPSLCLFFLLQCLNVLGSDIELHRMDV